MSGIFGASEVTGGEIQLTATHKNHFGVKSAELEEKTSVEEDFTSALKNAMGNANSLQQELGDITQAYITDPESVDAHDVTIAISKANMAIDITKSVVDGALKAYNNIVNMR